MSYNIVESGLRIRSLRMQMHLTQEQLAERVDTSRDNLANIETGRRGTSVELLARLSEVFGCSIDYLVFGREEQTKKEKVALEVLEAVMDVLEKHDYKRLK